MYIPLRLFGIKNLSTAGSCPTQTHKYVTLPSVFLYLPNIPKAPQKLYTAIVNKPTGNISKNFVNVLNDHLKRTTASKLKMKG